MGDGLDVVNAWHFSKPQLYLCIFSYHSTSLHFHVVSLSQLASEMDSDLMDFWSRGAWAWKLSELSCALKTLPHVPVVFFL